MPYSTRQPTFEEISSFFELPMTEAASKMQISLSKLKILCRELEIPRWPYRRVSTFS